MQTHNEVETEKIEASKVSSLLNCYAAFKDEKMHNPYHPQYEGEAGV